MTLSPLLLVVADTRKAPKVTKRAIVEIWGLSVCVAAILALVHNPGLACGPGTVDFRGGCAAVDVSEPVKPSDEAPPRSGRPSWEAPGVKAAMPESQAGRDAEADLAKEHEANVQQTEAMEGKVAR